MAPAKYSDKETITITISGRLDTSTAPELEKELDSIFPDCKNLIIDMANLEYISSAGLKPLLKAEKVMYAQGSLQFIHVPENILEFFDITGFSDLVSISN